VSDTKPQHFCLSIIGSARLDIMHEVGDSLAGHYFMHRLLPFSPAELLNLSFASDLGRFIIRGGFSESLLDHAETGAHRLRQQYIDNLFGTDIFHFNTVYNLRGIQFVFE
jgi:predicted AAA+ superfamily ATPase